MAEQQEVAEDDRIPEKALDDLNKAETFGSLWSQARAIVRPRDGRYWAAEIGAFAFVSFTALVSNATTSEIAKVVRDGSDKLFGFVGAILGIIIAAFAILATIAQSKAAVALAVPVEGKKDVLELKKIALLFVAAFVPFIVFAGWYGVLLLLGWQGGPATSFSNVFPRVGRTIACLVLGGTGFALTRMLIVLGALITNVYVTFMLVARAKIEEEGDIAPASTPAAAVPQLPAAPVSAAKTAPEVSVPVRPSSPKNN